MEGFFDFRTSDGFSPFGKTANLQLWYYNRLHNKTLDYDDWVEVFNQLEKEENDSKFAFKAKYDTMKKELNLEYNNFLDGLEVTQR